MRNNKRTLSNRFKNILLPMLTLLMMVTAVPVHAASTTNIAIGKAATASGSEAGSIGPQFAFDGIVSKASRWGSAYAAKSPWIEVDLGEIAEIDGFNIEWERLNAKEYEILVSNDGETYTSVVKHEALIESHATPHTLTKSVEGRYVKLLINDYNPTGADRNGNSVDYPTVSVYEFEVFGTLEVEAPEESEDMNYALNRPAFSNGDEDPAFVPSKAVDGLRSTDNSKSRWASGTNNGEKWLSVDLQSSRSIKTIIVEWERRNATDYEFQVSDDNTNWTTVAHFDVTSKSKIQRVVLNEAVTGRYVRVLINAFKADADGVTWNNVSIYELEVYGIEIEPTVTEIVEAIDMPVQTLDMDSIVLPTYPGATIEFYGADYTYIIDRDGTIYHPIVDTIVNVNLEVTIGDITVISQDIPTLVKGTLNAEDSINEKPVVVPALVEWFGYEGEIEINANTVISVDPNLSDAELASVNELVIDLAKMYDIELSVTTATTPTNGGIHFVSVDRDDLGKEGYYIEIDDAIVIESNNNTALYWSTRTILHILQSNDMSIPKGLIRDYPKWEVRGLLLDVGRKTFTFEFIEQLSHDMTWYKLNDFQVHLNDNYIFLEEYQRDGIDEFEAYSGFRLESDIEGLTSTDVYYSKDEFRSFIQDSRVRGMNIVPEFDVPAHSLAFTKIRPDLALGDNGREADHLDVTNPDSLIFVKELFDEYILGEDPVFDADTIVHIGTDEYSTKYSKPFLQFTDDLIEFVQGRDRQVRLWGSLSHFGGEVDVRSENVQMNIWNTGWSNPLDMFEKGFDMINMVDGTLYIVPDAGYYYDYLNAQGLYNGWNANRMGSFDLPGGSDQILGGAYAIWNDAIDNRQTGMSERDIYDRAIAVMPAMAQRLWGSENQGDYATFTENVKTIGKAPQANLEAIIDTVDENIFVYNFENGSFADKGNNGYDIIEQENVVLEDNVLRLMGGTSYVKNALNETKLGTTLQFSVKRGEATEGSEEILFESFNTQIKASINSSGNFGFTRESMDYESDYQLPIGEWVDVALTSRLKVTELYINGELVHTFTRNDDLKTYNATVLLPVGTIGSETDSFVGSIDNVRLVNAVDVDTTFTDKSELIAIIDVVNFLSESSYTEATWANLIATLEASIAVLEDVNATQEAVDAQVVALETAILSLEVKDNALVLDGLKKAIADAKAIDQTLYTEESVAALIEAITDAEALLEAAEAQNNAQNQRALALITQSDIDAAIGELVLRVETLELVDQDNAITPPTGEGNLPSTGSGSFVSFAVASIALGAIILVLRKKKNINAC